MIFNYDVSDLASKKYLLGESETEIPTGSNLNDYRTAGTYHIRTDTIAQNITNTPRNASGILYVIRRAKGEYYRQMYIPTSSNLLTYFRDYNNGTWTVWESSGGQTFVVLGYLKSNVTTSGNIFEQSASDPRITSETRIAGYECGSPDYITSHYIKITTGAGTVTVTGTTAPFSSSPYFSVELYNP